MLILKWVWDYTTKEKKPVDRQEYTVWQMRFDIQSKHF